MIRFYGKLFVFIVSVLFLYGEGQASEILKESLEEKGGKSRIVIGSAPNDLRLYNSAHLKPDDITINEKSVFFSTSKVDWWTQDWTHYSSVEGKTFDEIIVAYVGLDPIDHPHGRGVFRLLMYCLEPTSREIFSSNERSNLDADIKKTSYEEAAHTLIDDNFLYLNRIHDKLKPNGLFLYRSELTAPQTPLTEDDLHKNKSKDFDLTRQYPCTDYLAYILRTQYGWISRQETLKVIWFGKYCRMFFHEDSIGDTKKNAEEIACIYRTYEAILKRKGFSVESIGIIEEKNAINLSYVPAILQITAYKTEVKK